MAAMGWTVLPVHGLSDHPDNNNACVSAGVEGHRRPEDETGAPGVARTRPIGNQVFRPSRLQTPAYLVLSLNRYVRRLFGAVFAAALPRF